MPGLKKWCAHLTRHVNDTKVGKRPSHPKGRSSPNIGSVSKEYTNSIRSFNWNEKNIVERRRPIMYNLL